MPNDSQNTAPATPNIVTEEVPAAVPQSPQAMGGIAANAAPVAGVDNTFATQAPALVTPPPASSGGRFPAIAAILGILFLVGAVGAGIILVQQQQNLSEQAAPASKFCGEVSQPITTPDCDANNVCWKATAVNICLVNGQPQGATEYFVGNSAWDGQISYTCTTESDEPGVVKTVPGTYVGGNPALCPPGGSTPPTTPPGGKLCDDSCTTDAECGPIPGGGRQGNPITTTQLVCNTNIGKCVNAACPGRTWPNNQCECVTGQCTNVIIYDTSWNVLTPAALANLAPGTTIRAAVAGTSSHGVVQKARFTVNGTLRPETTRKKPNSQEFYDEFQIPAGATSMTIKGEVFVPLLEWF